MSPDIRRASAPPKKMKINPHNVITFDLGVPVLQGRDAEVAVVARVFESVANDLFRTGARNQFQALSYLIGLAILDSGVQIFFVLTHDHDVRGGRPADRPRGSAHAAALAADGVAGQSCVAGDASAKPEAGGTPVPVDAPPADEDTEPSDDALLLLLLAFAKDADGKFLGASPLHPVATATSVRSVRLNK